MVSPSTSYALDCAIEKPDQAFDVYDAVIVGTVDGVKKNKTNKTVTVNVEKSLKGVVNKTITVTEDLNWGISRANETYLYYLMKSENAWISPLCSPTSSDLSLVNQYLADKEELNLIENKGKAQASEQTHQAYILSIVLKAIALLTICCIFIGLLIMWRRRRLKR